MSLSRWATLSLLLLWMAACGDADNPGSAAPELSIARVSGSGQTGATDAVLASSLVILVTDGHGRPAPGQRVDFEVVSGDAAVLVETSVSDEKGFASTQVRLGGEPGEVVVRATVFPLNAATEFRLTAAAAGTGQDSGSGAGAGPRPFLVTANGGELVFELIEGEGLGDVEFGLGTPATTASAAARDVIFTVHLSYSGLTVLPSARVSKGYFPPGSGLDFYGLSNFGGSRYWAFSSHLGRGPSAADLVMFVDTDNSRRRGGSVVDTLGTDHWILHLDDGASVCCDDDDDELVVGVRVE